MVYEPPDAHEAVRVVALPENAGHREPYRAVVVFAGVAQRSRPASTVLEAIRWAEQVPLD